ncbi:mannose-1-phosphate guanylyltransferase/mannose-6-phosphate isomerase [Prochlorococcus marinus]|uniref:mannose-1-phosphate guanylyltransferase/mannose-6-phosphate isomerase n=1 Tax=Prochlorococcus marinus TaxID=1219 RepID=UPI001AD9FE54|nr:mannose-1-phosphate guanylyltransferase/mannose-6-phosphate isomerase [Prochlorococcus marinus]MBO8217676.1 mannose-1-phosphate guanylyltransferase/mannose-6-phosphate isomerase [Prochlorococcus marinus XMU1405]
MANNLKIKDSKIIPVILCGGSGTRLWPLSRASFPKQFISLNSDTKKSLLQKTQLRIRDLKNLSDPILICNEDHRFIVAEQIREIEVEEFSILLEPIGKNTAPGITVAALKALEKDPDPILLVLASDHEIKNNQIFVKALNEGINYALKDQIVTFGIIPNSPETGYGYIKASKPLSEENLKGEKIEQFLEKPDIKTAQELIKNKHYSWNSGIFIFKARTLLNEISKFSPEILTYCKRSLKNSIKDLDFQRLNKIDFEKCPNKSFDIAVMEKTDKGIVIPLNCGWNDIGSWKAIWENSKKDNCGNYIQGKVIAEKTKDSYLRSENRLIVGLGLDNLIVVETNDAVLIADKNQSQIVKNIVQKLKEREIIEGQYHKEVKRPWGSYLSLVQDLRWQVKLILIKPGQQLSLQMHHHRSEHWVVVSGTAKVKIDEKEKFLSENESIHIPLGSKHRLSNPGRMPLKIIEVQSGSYVGEDDIQRFADDYGRI